jgi:hypothetical protein
MPPPTRSAPITALTRGDKIIKALLADAGAPIRFINLHGFQLVNAGVLSQVKLLTTLTRPHRLISLQPICSLPPGNDVAVDILLSNDTLVDSGAELRDRHLSNGRLATNGWNASSFANPWPLNILITSRFTVYKLAMRNSTASNITFDVNLTLQLL